MKLEMKGRLNKDKILLANRHFDDAKQIIEILRTEADRNSFSEKVQRVLFLLKTSLSYGLGEAGYTLACLYSTGNLVNQDRKKVDLYLRLAACAFLPSVKGLRLHGIREYRIGNFLEAKTLLVRSAYLGNSDAALDLASMSTNPSTGAESVFRALETISVNPEIDSVSDCQVYQKILSKHSVNYRERLH